MPDSLLHAWHSTVDRRSGDVAVVEAPTGRVWTFSQLREAAERVARKRMGGEREVVCPQGTGVGFLIDVLAGWEAGCLVCPLDEGVSAPPSAFWRGMREVFSSGVLAKSTSGSSGVPRHVLFAGGQLMADARSIVSTMRLGAGWPNVAAISLAHSYGFSNLVLPLVIDGIPLVLAGSALPAAVRGALERVADGVAGERRAIVPGVPALWRAWLSSRVVDANRVAVAISAGAPLPLEVERCAWLEVGLKIHNFLGSSECGGMAYDRSDVPRDDSALVGTALEGVELSTDDGGQLLVRSEAVGLGYWPAEPSGEDGNAGALRPGVFRTGDIAECGAQGWRLLGRASDTVNLAGRKLHPSEVEGILRQHEAVKECLVFGVPSPDPARGEEVVAAVALHQNHGAAWNELPDWLAGRLPAWKCPRHWWPLPELTVTSRGKLPRSDWRQRYLLEQQQRSATGSFA